MKADRSRQLDVVSCHGPLLNGSYFACLGCLRRGFVRRPKVKEKRHRDLAEVCMNEVTDGLTGYLWYDY